MTEKADVDKKENTKKVPKKKTPQTIKTKKTGRKGAIKKKATGARDIGVEVVPPSKKCTDVNCPFHGTLPVRGQIMECEVVSNKMAKGAVVKRTRLRFVPKYERYEKKTSRYQVHNPPCINIKMGDKVKIMECRPLSKTKSFVIIEKIGGN